MSNPNAEGLNPPIDPLLGSDKADDDGPRVKTCTHCRLEKPIEQFLNKKDPSKSTGKCLECRDRQEQMRRGGSLSSPPQTMRPSASGHASGQKRDISLVPAPESQEPRAFTPAALVPRPERSVSNVAHTLPRPVQIPSMFIRVSKSSRQYFRRRDNVEPAQTPATSVANEAQAIGPEQISPQPEGSVVASSASPTRDVFLRFQRLRNDHIAVSPSPIGVFG